MSAVLMKTGFVQTVKGEGMPSYESASIRGDLFIEYNIVLPMEISQDARRSLYFFAGRDLSDPFCRDHRRVPEALVDAR